MIRFTIRTNEMQMECFIKSLLSLPDSGHLVHTTVSETLTIEFKGDIRKVQKEIYKWLSIPERKSNF